MSKLNLDLKLRKRALMLVGLASIMLAGCVQLDFVRDYPLAGYPSYSTSGGGGGYYPHSYYSGGPYPGAYGGYYSNGYYPRGYHPGEYFAGAYYPFPRGLYYAGERYSPFPDYYSDHTHLAYGCPHPSHRGGYAAPLTPPVVQPDESGPKPKAPRGRNGGPIKDWRDVERPAALTNRGSAAVRSPAALMSPPAPMSPAPPVGAGTARGRAVIPSPAVRAPVPVVTRSAPMAAPRSEPGTRGERSDRGPGLLQRALTPALFRSRGTMAVANRRLDLRLELEPRGVAPPHVLQRHVPARHP